MSCADNETMSNESRWWRGNLHAHSVWSDGDDFPEMVADRYKRRGYHFLAMTEHDQLAFGDRWVPTAQFSAERVSEYAARFGRHWLEQREGAEGTEMRLKPLDEFRHWFEEPGRFLLMAGEEVMVSVPDAVSSFVNVWNARDALAPITVDDRVAGVQKVVDAATAQARSLGRRIGVHLNHPNWNWNCRAEQIAEVPGLTFLEVFTALNSCNSHGDVLRASAERIWDVVLSLRLGRLRQPLVYGLATDDAHGYDVPGSTLNRAWVMVRSRYLTPQSIIQAMDRGDFYASTGVTLKALDCSPGRLSLEIEPQPGVTYRTQFVGTLKAADFTSVSVCDRQGREIDTTRRYSADIGRVLASTEGTEAAYAFSGEELYVRARVTSDRLHPLPHREGDTEMAWTQPVCPAD